MVVLGPTTVTEKIRGETGHPLLYSTILDQAKLNGCLLQRAFLYNISKLPVCIFATNGAPGTLKFRHKNLALNISLEIRLDIISLTHLY